MARPTFVSTTILSVRRGGEVAVGGDGQVTMNNTVLKGDASKIRRLAGGKVLCGFAGSTADAFALLERFEKALADHPDHLLRAATELAKAWRTDRVLRRLEALLIVADREATLLLSGTGDVVRPTDGLVAIGSGGNFALAAARALVRHTDLTARQIVEQSLTIAGEIDVFTNTNLVVETLAAVEPARATP